MSLQTNLANLATAVGTKAKALNTMINGNLADLSTLNTTQKGTLVAAINELKSALDALSTGAGSISDATTAGTSTWSSTKIAAAIAAANAALVSGSPAALDTLNEFAAALGNDANFAATTATALGNRVRVDVAQALPAPQQLQACVNIGVGDPTTNFVTVFNTALT